MKRIVAWSQELSAPGDTDHGGLGVFWKSFKFKTNPVRGLVWCSEFRVQLGFPFHYDNWAKCEGRDWWVGCLVNELGMRRDLTWVPRGLSKQKNPAGIPMQMEHRGRSFGGATGTTQSRCSDAHPCTRPRFITPGVPWKFTKSNENSTLPSTLSPRHLPS